MAGNSNLHMSKAGKTDEFYTQFSDIQREINAYLEYNPNVFSGKTIFLPCDDPEWSNFTKFFAQNFEKLGLKKLISTSYANEKKEHVMVQLSLFEQNSPKFDKTKTQSHGKLFILERDTDKSGKINIEDIDFEYLNGDGDFRSEEVKKIRDEADVIITNPPFSLFREFLAWIMEAKKEFLIIGSLTSATYSEVFPYIKNNKMWLGNGFNAGNAYFSIPENCQNDYVDGVYDPETKLVKFRNCCWYTNIELGNRHQIMQLMTMEDNIKYSKHKEVKNIGYKKYDNYDAIHIPYTDSIPRNYKGKMGVPVSFLSKYNPNQFQILGEMATTKITEDNFGYPYVDGKKVFARIIIIFKEDIDENNIEN